MTYDDWLTCRDLDAMLTYARRRGHFTARKRRLFACACCQKLGRLLPEAHRRALAVAERFADGLASRVELTAAWSGAYDDLAWLTDHAAWAAYTAAGPSEVMLTQGYLSTLSLYAANALSGRQVRACAEGPGNSPAWHAERARHRALLRDMVPPPRAVRLDVRASPAAVAVARWIYEERRFEGLPILADALEEAGVAGEVLEHCRLPSEHVRGCWVLDLLRVRQ
jgi:hypothetical protein